MKNYLRKELFDTLWKGLHGQPNLIQVVTGPRQIGKTTLALQVMDRWKGPKLYQTLKVNLISRRLNGLLLNGVKYASYPVLPDMTLFSCWTRFKKYHLIRCSRSLLLKHLHLLNNSFKDKKASSLITFIFLRPCGVGV